MISPQELIERITEAAEYDDCIVIITEQSQANLRWANSTLTTNGVIAERSVTVIAFVAVDGGMASGVVTRTDIADEEIVAIAREAGNAAHAAGKANDAAELARNLSMGSWSDPHAATGPEIFATIAPELGDMFQHSRDSEIELFGYAEHTHRTTWVGSKGGLRLRWDQPAGRIEMTGKSHQRTRSTWEGVATRDFANVSIAEIDAVIRQRLDWQSKRIDIPAGRYDTVMPAGSVGDLLTFLVWSAGGRDAYEGRSVFSGKSPAGPKTRVGERISNQKTNLYSDPTYAGLEAAPFIVVNASGPMSSVFDNGQALRTTKLLNEGEVTSLIQTRSSAADTQLPFTPMGENFIMNVSGAKGTLLDLVANLDDGLLLTTLWYIREVDPRTLLLTGLTRDGVYRVKGGEVIGAVNNFRWNESPVDLLSRMKAVGSTQITQLREWGDYVDRVAMPPVVFENFNMSTVSLGN
jgi:predicted Zn-dependent protease